jgi:hypothetical protein
MHTGKAKRRDTKITANAIGPEALAREKAMRI